MTSEHKQKTTGTILDDGALVEMLYDPIARRTSLAKFSDETWAESDRIERPDQPDLVPYSATNALIENRVVRFPSHPAEFGSDADLIADVRAFVHRYVDLSETFEQIATYYVLFSWVYDAFNELPYLRVRGDYGSGKSRFLTIIGSLTYKPIFGSGASTMSPLFYLMHQFGGTLIIDEADFRVSDEKAELVKILNNGNAKGFPVLRSISQKNGEFSPRAFHVFGPKIIASRGRFDDKALESRFITEDMGNRTLRSDIPINLPVDYEQEALRLRNKLLMYRFRHRPSARAKPELIDRAIEARISQVFVPLLSIIDDPAVRAAVVDVAKSHQKRGRYEREDTIDARVLTVLRFLFDSTTGMGVAISDVAKLFAKHYADEVRRPITDRWMGGFIRGKLGFGAHKSHGRFIIPLTQRDKLMALSKKFNISDGDVRALEEWEKAGAKGLGDDGMSLVQGKVEAV